MTKHRYAASSTDLVNAKYAYIVGNPAKHSLSPKLHNAAYRYLNLPFQYSILEIAEPECIEVIEKLRGGEVFGLSFTMPYKELAYSIANEVTTAAELTGAVNTLVYRNSQVVGENTDIIGLKNAIGAHFDATQPWTVIGTGATSRSALVALNELGASEIWVIGRNQTKLAESKDRFNVSIALYDQDYPMTNVISTIPANGQELIIDKVRNAKFVLDVNYWPWPTEIASALNQDAAVISGIEMLVYQAAAQIEIMVGEQVPVEILFAALT